MGGGKIHQSLKTSVTNCCSTNAAIPDRGVMDDLDVYTAHGAPSVRVHGDLDWSRSLRRRSWRA
jgi:hypothetical protein